MEWARRLRAATLEVQYVSMEYVLWAIGRDEELAPDFYEREKAACRAKRRVIHDLLRWRASR